MRISEDITKKMAKEDAKLEKTLDEFREKGKLIYAQYEMGINETKLFLYIIKSKKYEEDYHKEEKLPLKVIKEIWGNEYINSHAFIAKMINSLAKSGFTEEYELLEYNEKTKKYKKGKVFIAFPIFLMTHYRECDDFITYTINKHVIKSILNLKRNFNKTMFDNTQLMKSVYGIRLYNILLRELTQSNNQILKVHINTLRFMLYIPNELTKYKEKEIEILQEAQDNINSYSNIVLKNFHVILNNKGKIKEIDFSFDFKDKYNTKQPIKELHEL